MADQVDKALQVNIHLWASMTVELVDSLSTPSYDSGSSVAGAASALQLVGQATSILIPKTAPALAIPIFILENATKFYEKQHQTDLEAANESKDNLEEGIRRKLKRSILEAEDRFYGSDSYGNILNELKRYLRQRSIDTTSTDAYDKVNKALNRATVNGHRVIPQNYGEAGDKGSFGAKVQNRYHEIFETVRTLHRAVSSNVGAPGIFGVEPYIRTDSDLSELAKKHLGSPRELCRNPGDNLQKKPPTIRKGVCGDKSSDAVFEAYYISGPKELRALVNDAWPMAIKLKTDAVKNGLNVVPNERRISRWHVELVAAERGNFQRNAGEAALQRAKQNTGKVIRSLKEELDKQIA